MAGCATAPIVAPASSARIALQPGAWWNRGINYAYINQYGWYDTDLNVSASTVVQLRHDSRLEKTGVMAGLHAEFTDLATGKRFRMLHLRPQHQNATTIGHVYPAASWSASRAATPRHRISAYPPAPPLHQTLEPYRNCSRRQDACPGLA